jgi:hypothetical protein
VSHVLSIVDLFEDNYMFGTIGPKPTPAISSLKTRIHDFVHSPGSDSALHSAASKVFKTVQDHHKNILGHAVAASLYHVANIDFPSELQMLFIMKL